MRYLSIIFALLISSVVATAQSNTGDAAYAIAALTNNPIERPLASATNEETEASELVLTTDKKINAVKVLDESGDVVMSSSASNGESVKFNFRKLQKGLYYLHIYCEGEKIVRKFLRK